MVATIGALGKCSRLKSMQAAACIARRNLHTMSCCLRAGMLVRGRRTKRKSAGCCCCRSWRRQPPALSSPVRRIAYRLGAGVLVEDARQAHDVSVAHGARSVLPPRELADAASGTSQVVSEVALYGDVVLRYVSGTFQARRSPAAAAVSTSVAQSFQASQ